VDGFLTVGQRAAVAAVHAMLASRVPHAVLLVGPPSVGKHALALDLAAALLCTGATGLERPCRACRGCRMVEHGNHPDLHRLAPSGAGNQIRIGDDLHPEPGTIRRLAADLALLPVEGGERVAVIRDAQRMNDVAQSALLKTLEEPPPATTLLLCTDDEEQLLPTIRSRCARVRLGTLATRDVERLLEARGLADPPAAARLARFAGGRPGVAVAYASAPEAEAVRAELVLTLLDLAGRPPAARLGAARDLLVRAMALAAALDPAPAAAAASAPRRRGRGRAEAPAMVSAQSPEPTGAEPPAGEAPEPTDATAAETGTGKASAAERRRALALVLELWRDLARDLAFAQLGTVASVRDVARLEEIEATAGRLRPGAAADALARLLRAGELLEVNASPELLLDVLLVRWPRAEPAP
jgi:DNA polymerase-3 subunit delta'